MKNDRLLENIKTKREAERLLEEIEILRNGLFEAGGDAFKSLLKNKVRAITAENIRQVFAKEGIDKRKYLDEIEELVMKMPNVSLILAFEPSEGAVERFYTRISEATGRQVLLDVVYEPQIIGGAVIIFNGRYRDFSFKKIFEAEFEKGRSKILELEKNEIANENNKNINASLTN
jgi:hypothetical protein